MFQYELLSLEISYSVESYDIMIQTRIQKLSNIRHQLSGFFPTKDMQTPRLSFAPVLMKDAQCAESIENQFSI